MEDQQATFGEYAREVRLGAGYTLREAAEKLGITPGHLSKVETDRAAPPKGETLSKMARLYEVPLSKFASFAPAPRFAEAARHESGFGSVVSAFYRIGAARPSEHQIQMLEAALEAVEMAPDERAYWSNFIQELRRSEGESFRRFADESGLWQLPISPRVLSATNIEDIAGHIREYASRKQMQDGTQLFDGELPIPIERIAEYLEATVRVSTLDEDHPDGQLIDGAPEILGRTCWNAERTIREVYVHERLLYSDDQPAKRRGLFTLAHEYFHAIEHLDRLEDVHGPRAVLNRAGFVSMNRTSFDSRPARLRSNEDWIEWQANQFAACMLMPREYLVNDFEALFESTQLGVEGCALDGAKDIARMPVIVEGGVRLSLSDRYDVNPHAMAIRLLNLKLVVKEGD